MYRILILALMCCLLHCKSPEARRPVAASSTTFINDSVERNIKLNAEEQKLFEAYIAKDTLHNYIASPHGFWYYYTNKSAIDTLKTAVFGDLINFNYNVKKLNGETIYSFEELKNQNYMTDKEELFSGLREGLKLLKAGESATFLFPSLKAYGYYGDEDKITRNEPLICDVVVNSIQKPKK